MNSHSVALLEFIPLESWCSLHQQQLIHWGCQIKTEGRVGIHALAQSRTRRYSRKTQRTLEEDVLQQALDAVEVALTQAQQGKGAFEKLAFSQTRAHWELGINQEVEVDAPKVFADQSQSGVGAEVVGQLLDYEVGHVWIYLRCEQDMRAKDALNK